MNLSLARKFPDRMWKIPADTGALNDNNFETISKGIQKGLRVPGSE